MEKQPLDKIIGKITKDLQSGIDAAMLHLQQGMQNYLTNSIDLPRLLNIIQEMGIPNIMKIMGTSTPGMDYYKILGLDKTASNNEVKERYRVIMSKLHPDKAGDEMTFLASLVNTAYKIICKERNM